MTWINEERQKILKNHLSNKIEEAKKQGVEFFLGIPDSWYETGLHCCNNGHISTRYLKCEDRRGALCLECRQPSHIYHGEMNEKDFMKLLETLK